MAIDPDTARDAVQKFRRRARILKRLAYAVLLLIGVALGGGVYLFVIAGELVSREADRTWTQALDQARASVLAFAPEAEAAFESISQASNAAGAAALKIPPLIDSYRQAAESLTRAAEEFQSSAGNSSDAELRRELREALTFVNQSLFTDDTRRALSSLHDILSNVEATSADLAYISGDIRNVWIGMRPDGSGDTAVLLSALSTRIGSLLVLVFLVQILVNLYRYNIRLASYFDARADVFEIVSSGEGESVETLVRVLSPENLDFGKMPDSPSQQAVELAREIIARQR